jgi:hypothetical protein
MIELHGFFGSTVEIPNEARGDFEISERDCRGVEIISGCWTIGII